MAAKPNSGALMRVFADALDELGELQVRRLLQDALKPQTQGRLPLRAASHSKRLVAARRTESGASRSDG